MSQHTLLLRCAGPMQAWGASSRWTERDTGSEPSKSGIVGLLAAALGRARGDDVSDIAELVMGVRVDQPGIPRYDFQTAGAGEDSGGIAQAQGGSQRGVSISNRHYLADAIFLVGLEGDNLAFLLSLDGALRAPVFPLGLGRRGFAPSVPVAMPGTEAGAGVRANTALRDALAREPWPKDLVSWQRRTQPASLPVILQAQDQTADAFRDDQPVGRAFADRTFAPRGVVYGSVTLERSTSHAQ